MSKCSVFSTWNLNSRCCTLFRPKCALGVGRRRDRENSEREATKEGARYRRPILPCGPLCNGCTRHFDTLRPDACAVPSCPFCILAIAYRYYSAFIAARIMVLDDRA